MNRLIVAFESESTISRVREMLSSAAVPVRAVCRTGMETVRQIKHMGGGIVVCGARLADMTADGLLDDLEGMAHVLVIAKPEQLEMCSAQDVFKLPLPTNRYDLAASVKMLLQLDDMDSRRKNRRSDSDNLIIARAKQLLCDTFGMTEADAHQHLQKRSMDTGARMADVAAMVIEACQSCKL